MVWSDDGGTDTLTDWAGGRLLTVDMGTSAPTRIDPDGTLLWSGARMRRALD